MTSHLRTRLLVVPALLLVACAQRPVPVVMPGTSSSSPAQWRNAAGSQPVAIAWWQQFGDATLTRLIDEALTRNQDLRQAAARVTEAHALAVAQHGAFWPTLDAGVGGARSRSISDVTLKPYLSTGHQSLFQAGYEVDLWGRVDALARAADTGEQATRAARDAIALSVAASVAQAYIGLLELDAQLDVAQRLLASRERSLLLVRRRHALGYANALELAQAESDRHAGAQALPQLRRAMERQEAQLNLLLNRAPGAVERGGWLSALHPCALPDAGLPSELLRRRPDVHVAELQVAASDAQLAAARTQWLPSLHLNASLGRTGASVLRGDPFTLWSLGGSVLAPLFNGGRLRALADASAARREQALAAYEHAVLGAWAEVEVQLNAHEQQATQLREALAQRDAMAEALRVTERRHDQGQVSTLEALQAERQLLAVEQGVLNLQSGLLHSQVALFRALGGGWSRNIEPDPSRPTQEERP
ncbi:efflux transporter outer membrane subunit [Roseateles amylovorans]|uniref:Efflux transporter outer membrane subunit n=1 Tax=Roseateles amylovorans TaxID=2978473 RepID=A0ABY6B3I0_9BURK|nr:efflux transporter outer membrane subunit [Roseateles amylovorans]UXH79948.1 efflux transporter outer membrane subunit [Roseateles amylovorans]